MKNKPNLIIAGVNKAGTTSLFRYLSDHPQVCASAVKETCYFLPLAFGEQPAPFSEYLSRFGHCRDQKYSMEATPGYFYGHTTIPRAMKERLGEATIIIVLRDPIERLYSFYRALISLTKISETMTFHEYIQEAMRHLDLPVRQSGSKTSDSIYRGVREGMYARYIPEWITTFGASLHIVYFEHMRDDPDRFLNLLCVRLGIDPGFYEGYRFEVENKTIAVKNRVLHKLGLLINKKNEVFFRKHPAIKNTLRKAYLAVNERERTSNSLSRETRELLHSFYGPHNTELVKLLKANGYADFPQWLQRGQ